MPIEILVQIYVIILLVTFLFIPFVITYGLSDTFSDYWNKKTLSCFYWIYNKLGHVKFIKNNSFVLYIVSLNLFVADLIYILNEIYMRIAMFLFIPCFIIWFISLSIDKGFEKTNFDKIYLEFASTVFTAFLIGLIFDGINISIILIEIILLAMISFLSRNINKKEALRIN